MSMIALSRTEFKSRVAFIDELLQNYQIFCSGVLTDKQYFLFSLRELLAIYAENSRMHQFFGFSSRI